MGLFFYTKKGSIISTVDLPTTEIIEPKSFDWYKAVIASNGEKL
jgi:beta-glucosidase/6-phospho-beta-glucosidase/beta-galactosidase